MARFRRPDMRQEVMEIKFPAIFALNTHVPNIRKKPLQDYEAILRVFGSKITRRPSATYRIQTKSGFQKYPAYFRRSRPQGIRSLDISKLRPHRGPTCYRRVPMFRINLIRSYRHYVKVVLETHPLHSTSYQPQPSHMREGYS